MPLYTDEKHASQLPAVRLLVAMGYDYMPIGEAMRQRQGAGNVLLEEVLREQMDAI